MFHYLKSASIAASALLLLLSSTVHSMPANPEPRIFVQPDGSSFEARPQGDERMAWFETNSGDILVYNPLSKSYEYGEIQHTLDGIFLRPSGLLFGQANPTAIPLVAFEELQAAWAEAWEAWGGHDHSHAHDHSHGSESAPETTSGEGSPEGPAAAPSGNYLYPSLFIMIEFNDFQFVSDEAVWSDKIFGGYPGTLTAGSLNDYYQEISDGQLLFAPADDSQGTTNDGFVKVQLNMSHPQYARNWSGWRSVLQDAFDQAKSYVDFSQYDVNQNGVIDKTELLVSFIISGRESSYSGSEDEGFWGHAYFSYNFGNDDGVDVSTGYMGFGERQGPANAPYDSTLGIIAHEFGHSAFNLRDLYSQPSAISYWGLMGSGSWGYKSGDRLGARPVHMTAYSKMNVYLQGGQRGFFQPTTVTPSESAQLITTSHPFTSGSYDFFRIPGEFGGRYWLVEQRKVQGYDEGVIRNGNTEFSAGDTGVVVSYSESTSRLWIQRMNGQTGGTRRTDMLYAGNVTRFAPDTTPSSNYPNSDNYSGLVIDQVSAPADQMTAYVSLLPEPPFQCVTHVDTVENHQNANRVYSQLEGQTCFGSFCWGGTTQYYAIGSNESLGTFYSPTVTELTLYESDENYYSTTECVNEEDTTPPVISLNGQSVMTVYQGTTWSDPGFAATDDTDGYITQNVVITGSVNTAVIGQYVLRYNVSDAAGNPAAEVTRTVNVVADTVAPTISLSGATDITIYVDTNFVEPGYSASDNVDGDLTSSVIVSGTVDTTTVGDYTLRYNVSDAAGNPAQEQTRVVHVIPEPQDNVAPEITLLGAADMTITVQSAFTDPGATATDNVDGDITDQIVVTGSVDTTTVGDYTLRYNVTDAAGNPAQEVTRVVHVVAQTCQEHTSTINQHIAAGRAYTCGSFSYEGCAVGSDTNLGLTFLTTQVTLREEPEGYFDLGSCN